MPSLGIDVVERIIGSAVDYIMIQDAIPGIGRRITSITEVDYDYAKQRVALKTIVRFDVPTKQFVFENRLAKIKADKMLRKGIKPHELSKWAEGFEQYALDPNEPSLFECDKKKDADVKKTKEEHQVDDDDM